MSDAAREFISAGPPAITPSSVRTELRRFTLLYWGQLIKWSLLLIVLGLVSALLGEPPNVLLYDYEPGFAVLFACAVAAFPAGLAVAMRSSGFRHAGVRALFGSTLLIALVSIGVNGFLVPLRVRAGLSDRERDRVPSSAVTLFGVRDARLTSLREIQDLRRSLSYEQRNRGVTAGAPAVDAAERRRIHEAQQQRDESIQRQIRILNWRIQALTFRNQLVFAVALLPLLSTWLGFLTGRWSTLARPGMQRQLFTWTAGMCVIWSSGYTLLTGFVIQGQQRGLEVQALPHFLMLPVLLLLLLGVSWLIIGRRIAPLVTHG